jgi:hypothetical protein
MATDVSRVAIGPGAFPQGASGMGMARLGDTALTTALATGICRRGEAEITHLLSGVVNTCEVTQCRHAGDGDGALHPTQGLEDLNHGDQAPGLDLLMACARKPLQAFGGLVHRPDGCLADDLLRGGGTDHLREPAEVGWAPGGPPSIAEIVSQQKGFEPEFGGLQLAQGILAGTTEVTNGFLLDRGDLDRCEIARAQQAGPWHGVTTVGFDAIAGLFGNQGRGDHPADVPPCGEIAIEPIPTGAGFIDKDEGLALRAQLPDEHVEVALARPNGAEEDDLRGMILRHVGDRDRLLMDIQSDIECARLGHG